MCLMLNSTACPTSLPAYLGVVGLLQLLLVEVDLVLVLASQLGQGFGQLALVVLLPPAVDLHQTRGVLPLGLVQLLQTQTG